MARLSRSALGAVMLLMGTARADEVAPAPPPAASAGGPARVALALGGAAAAAAGTAWFLVLGDGMGAGDGASMLVGGGLIAAAGSAVGGLAVATLRQDEGAIDDRAFTPPVRLSVGAPGTTVIGESVPAPLSLSLSPRLHVSDRLRVTPSATGRAQLGSKVDIDPRPQSEGEVALTSTTRGGDADIELRYFTGADPRRTRLDLIWRPMAGVRTTATTAADGSERVLRRAELMPLTVGGRWHLSGRQRFEVIAGPRVDRVAWLDRSAWVALPSYPGRLYMAATYQVEFEHARTLVKSRATSRLEGRYIHSTFDGVGANAAAVVGFFGPVELRYDLRLRKRPAAWAPQAGLVAVLGDGGGGALTIGLVPPAPERP